MDPIDAHSSLSKLWDTLPLHTKRGYANDTISIVHRSKTESTISCSNRALFTRACTTCSFGSFLAHTHISHKPLLYNKLRNRLKLA